MPHMIRRATPDDLHAIADLIRALAEYEKLAHACVLDEPELAKHLFGADAFVEVVIAIDDDAHVVVGFALFFPNFSTFLGKPGIWLEDLFVYPQHRGRGYGKALLAHLAGLVIERGWGRLEWSVLDWNQPSIEFYRSVGAAAMDEWTTHRVTGDALAKLAGVATG